MRNKTKFLFAILPFLISCRSSFPEYLIGDFRPGENFDKIEISLKKSPKDITVIENRKLKSGDPRPRFDILSIEFSWEDLGVPGTVKLLAFNNILSEVWFFPADYDLYLKKLFDQKNVDLIHYNEGQCGSRTTILKGIDYKNRPYVLWEDDATVKIRENWIRKYS